MKVSDVFAQMNIEVVIRGDIEYSNDLDIASLNIDYPNNDAPSNEQFHDAAALALKENRVKEYSRALQNHIDNVAREKNYENGFTCATYINSSNPQWQAEAQAFVTWRDLCWEYALDIYEQVENGLIQPPALEDFIANLPLIDWPPS